MARVLLHPIVLHPIARCAAILLLAGAAAAPAEAQRDRRERHRVPADYMSFLGAQWLERDSRVEEEQPERVLDAMALSAGDVVADIGCGSGYYARRMVPRVQPGGRVYCEDIQPEMLEIMDDLAAEDGVTGITPILGTPVDAKLPPAAVDWIIIADVYHEMSDPEPMLASIRAALAPGGQVALVEYRVEDGSADQIKADHAMSVRQVLLEWQAAGFELVALHDVLPMQHLFIFRPADDVLGASPWADYDLFEAIDAGVVDVEAVARGADDVVVRIRRTTREPLVITSPVGTYFRAAGARDLIARRDGWIVLSEDGWHEWRLRVVGRQPDRDPAPAGAPLEIESPDAAAPRLADVLYQLQAGTYAVAGGPTLYPPRVRAIDQAAIWIADADASYAQIARHLVEPAIAPEAAVAFALVFCEQAGIVPADRRIWDDRAFVFGSVRDRGLDAWYRARRPTRR